MTALTGERGPSRAATTEREHTMNTTHTRGNAVRAALRPVVGGGAMATARRSLKMLIVLFLALGAILLSLSATVAHAGPGDIHDSPNPPAISSGPTAQVPLQVHASENPVFFQPWETTKTITFAWNPVPQPAAVIVHADGQFLWIKQADGGSHGPLDLTVTAGKTYTIRLKTSSYQIGPLLTITTKKPVMITTAPEITISTR